MKIGGFEVGEYTVKESAKKRHLLFNCKDCIYSANLADDKACRYHAIHALGEIEADLIVLAEVYERVYDENQTKMLTEMAMLRQKFEIESMWAYSKLGDIKTKNDEPFLPSRHKMVVSIGHDLIAYDPIKAYLTCLQEVQREKKKYEQQSEVYKKGSKIYLQTLLYLKQELEKTELIQKSKKFLMELEKIPETKDIYHSFFEAEVKPSFIGSRLLFDDAEELEILDDYNVGSANIQIFNHPSKTENLYFINPPEYTLSPEKYFVLSKTKEVVAGYQPGKASLSTVAKSRSYFERVYQSTIADVAEQSNIKLEKEEIKELASIVARYTVGYGVLEILLNDKRITDVYLDSPIGENPLYVVHSDFGQCKTNILYSENEAQSLITKIRAMSGRPFDEAHPILDYDLPNFETRVAVIGPPLSPDGIAFAFRLHKVTPWTLPQFIDVKYMNPLSTGFLSFMIDNQSTMLVTGSRGSGKTSLMGSLLLEILKSSRIIVQEDSVTADAKILVEKKGIIEKTTVGELIDSQLKEHGCEIIDGREILPVNVDGVKVFSMNNEGKTELSYVSQFTRHKADKELFEVKTRSGKIIKVTADHSLFSLKNNEIVPIKTKEIVPGSFVATPRTLPLGSKKIEKISAFDKLLALKKGFIIGEELKLFIKENWAEIKELSAKQGYSAKLHSFWKRRGLLPILIFKELDYSGLDKDKLLFKLDKKAKEIPLTLTLNKNLLNIVGLWLADGCYDSKYGIVISTPDCEKEIQEFASSVGLKARRHSDNFSFQISNTGLVFLFKEILNLKGNSYTKKFPSWVFNLSKEQIANVLQGLYSGDGYTGKHEVGIGIVSKELTESIRSLLLFYGITPRTRFVKRDKTFNTRISSVNMLKKFQEHIGFIQERKNNALAVLCERQHIHDVTDVVPFSISQKQAMNLIIPGFNNHDYVTRDNSLGRKKLKSYVSSMTSDKEVEKLKNLAFNDIFWDEVIEVKSLGKTKEFVYDFSVPGNENFVCEDIIAHNTLELPVPYMKKIGFNVQRLKTRSAVGASTSSTEVSPEDALRTALRLGDSAIILGEVRSKEAKTLYEGMRVGAAGNVVMGTIHGDSAYSVWDRVVNDLDVPTTSFKATDLVVVARPIRFSGSLKKHRRVTQITEVKKHWTTDPEEEGGLLDLMLYDAKKDDLELMEDSLKDSDLFKKISKTSGLTMKEMWKDIEMRGNSKAFMVEMKNQYNIPDLLEAENTSIANDKLLLLREKQIQEYGKIDFDEILGEWKNWVKNSLVKKVVKQSR